jgi:hypothetical protein
MKLWTSGEIDSTVGEKFRKTMILVEQEVNKILASCSYGDGLENWDLIYIISANPGKEKVSYSPKKRESDIRLNVNYTDFLLADDDKARKLFIDTLIISINKITFKYKIPDFNHVKLVNDLLILRNNGI